MRTPHRAGLAVAALAAAPLLAACQKPTPLVTIFANGQTYHRAASAFTTDGKQHLFPDVNQPIVPVSPGSTVAIDVDRSIAHGTWVASIDEGADANGSPQQQAITMSHDTHYASFVMPTATAGGQALPVGAMFVLRITVTTGETGRTDDRVGQWIFNLKVAA